MATTGYHGLFPMTRRPGSRGPLPIVFFDDFIGVYSVLDLALDSESDPAAQFSPVANRGAWLVSGDSVAASDTPLPLSSTDSGVFSIKSSAVSGNRTQVQINGLPFRFVSPQDGQPGKDRPIYFEARCRVSTRRECDAFIGLCTNTVDAHADVVAGTSGFSYVGYTLTGDEDVEIATGQATGTPIPVIDSGVDYIANDFHTYAFYSDSRGSVRWYFDGSEVYKTSTNVPVEADDDTQIFMSPCFCVESNAAQSEAFSVDYLLIVAERA